MTTQKRGRRPVTRIQAKMIVVAAATLLCSYLCYRLARPFIPALVWAVTVAVVTQPFVQWLKRRIKAHSWRAAVSVSAVTLLICLPVAGMAYLAAVEIQAGIQNWQPARYLERWQTALANYPRAAALWQNISENLNLTTVMEQVAGRVNETATAVISGSVYSLVQALIMLFVLYYLYRDEDLVLATVRSLSPLTEIETNRLLNRLGDTIHATIYGTVVVAIIQGALGGVIFWLLGLPGAILWGLVMAVLAIIPYLGAFVVWAPAAAFLFAEGHWVKSLILVGWGTIVIGLIDNLLYPILVGNRLRQHTVVAFLAIVGGIAAFGTVGLIIGPVVVSLTVFLLEIWRRRTAPA